MKINYSKSPIYKNIVCHRREDMIEGERREKPLQLGCG